MTYVVNGTPKAQKWTNFDQQTELKKNAEGKQDVDHAKSAKANLKEAGRNFFVETFTPDKIRDLMKDGGSDVIDLRPLFLPYAIAFDIADLVAGPLKAVKNLGDAAAHGVMAGVEKLKG